VKDADAVFRTDVFPGLGWMITLNIWREIGGKWPQNYWDEWMRLPEVRAPLLQPVTLLVDLILPQVHKGRSVLRPEICRTRTFGEEGSSKGQFFEQFLSRIELSSRAVVWTGVDLSYLRSLNRCARMRS
jgi:alpha-1,3-mannosyl-glycoprotein beta-1,2-N-acetylglucosaminyltransferase